MEKWKPVVGFEGLYEVSSRGTVRRVGGGGGAVVGRVLKTSSIRPGGYPTVSLFKDRKRFQPAVHILVASAFLGARPDGLHVHHIDHDPSNPCVENLVYVTRSQNMRHALNANRCSRYFDVETVKRIGEEVRWFPDAFLAEKYGVSIGNINLIRKGRSWSHVTGITKKVEYIRPHELASYCCGFCQSEKELIRSRPKQ